jgi:hypothetical protein
VTDRATQTQYTQLSQILASVVFSPEERRQWLLEFGTLTRFEARDAITRIAAEYKARQRKAAA